MSEEMKTLYVVLDEVDIGEKKIALVTAVDDEMLDGKPLSKWFIINALGQAVYIKTRKREDAQKAIDVYYGNGKYRLRTTSLEKSANAPNVRASETRRGQAVQRNKARILNS